MGSQTMGYKPGDPIKTGDLNRLLEFQRSFQTNSGQVGGGINSFNIPPTNVQSLADLTESGLRKEDVRSHSVLYAVYNGSSYIWSHTWSKGSQAYYTLGNAAVQMVGAVVLDSSGNPKTDSSGRVETYGANTEKLMVAVEPMVIGMKYVLRCDPNYIKENNPLENGESCYWFSKNGLVRSGDGDPSEFIVSRYEFNYAPVSPKVTHDPLLDEDVRFDRSFFVEAEGSFVGYNLNVEGLTNAFDISIWKVFQYDVKDYAPIFIEGQLMYTKFLPTAPLFGNCYFDSDGFVYSSDTGKLYGGFVGGEHGNPNIRVADPLIDVGNYQRDLEYAFQEVANYSMSGAPDWGIMQNPYDARSVVDRPVAYADPDDCGYAECIYHGRNVVEDEEVSKVARVVLPITRPLREDIAPRPNAYTNTGKQPDYYFRIPASHFTAKAMGLIQPVHLPDIPQPAYYWFNYKLFLEFENDYKERQEDRLSDDKYEELKADVERLSEEEGDEGYDEWLEKKEQLEEQDELREDEETTGKVLTQIHSALANTGNDICVVPFVFLIADKDHINNALFSLPGVYVSGDEEVDEDTGLYRSPPAGVFEWKIATSHVLDHYMHYPHENDDGETLIPVFRENGEKHGSYYIVYGVYHTFSSYFVPVQAVGLSSHPFYVQKAVINTEGNSTRTYARYKEYTDTSDTLSGVSSTAGYISYRYYSDVNTDEAYEEFAVYPRMSFSTDGESFKLDPDFYNDSDSKDKNNLKRYYLVYGDVCIEPSIMVPFTYVADMFEEGFWYDYFRQTYGEVLVDEIDGSSGSVVVKFRYYFVDKYEDEKFYSDLFSFPFIPSNLGNLTNLTGEPLCSPAVVPPMTTQIYKADKVNWIPALCSNLDQNEVIIPGMVVNYELATTSLVNVVGGVTYDLGEFTYAIVSPPVSYNTITEGTPNYVISKVTYKKPSDDDIVTGAIAYDDVWVKSIEEVAEKDLKDNDLFGNQYIVGVKLNENGTPSVREPFGAFRDCDNVGSMTVFMRTTPGNISFTCTGRLDFIPFGYAVPSRTPSCYFKTANDSCAAHSVSSRYVFKRSEEDGKLYLSGACYVPCSTLTSFGAATN